MTIAETLLGLLEAAPRHGYDLRRDYEHSFGERRPIKPAQVYATLGRLSRDGAIHVVSVEQVGGPERTTYALTPDGVTRLERWFAEPEGHTPYLQSVVFTKLILALRSGRPAGRVLHAQRTAHVASMRELIRRKSGADLTTVLACDFTIFHLEADLRWLEHTAARLDRLALELA
ncbi:PadR family transcriptional regulator [Phytohabitans rumicis]|uniref:PadR family transcriptional regulator n=1 Tax=Phytohabitans rumicis TaxID=1076125 RepID=UPI00156462F5|nr:PadR family transcriptional regulator [Phytohabitans rumicis]